MEVVFALEDIQLKIYIHNVILLHPVALCNFDLGIMIPSGATLFI
jgi:hypothetical protein